MVHSAAVNFDCASEAVSQEEVNRRRRPETISNDVCRNIFKHSRLLEYAVMAQASED